MKRVGIVLGMFLLLAVLGVVSMQWVTVGTFVGNPDRRAQSLDAGSNVRASLVADEEDSGGVGFVSDNVVSASGASANAAAVLDPESYALSLLSNVHLDRDPDLGTPHFIRRRNGFLSPPAPGIEPQAILTAFIEANARTMTLHPSDLEEPNGCVVRDYVTVHNGMRHVVWQQRHDGIDVFGARLALNLTAENEIINISSRALHIPSVMFHDEVKVDEEEAAEIARESLNHGWTRMDTDGERKEEDGESNIQHSTSNAQHQMSMIQPPRRVYYPLDMISCVMSWEVAVAYGELACNYGIRADTGEIVHEQSLTWGLSDISLNVYTNDSPAPMTPGPSAPTNWVPPEVPRTWVTLTALDTNASPEGWVPDGNNELLGNNANVYADWNDDDAPDSARVTGTPYRVFDEAVDLADYPTDYVDFSKVQAFYWANMFHDRLYALGFDEAAGNFQSDNFGRGGNGGDALKIEVQNGADYGFSHANKAWYQGFGDGSEGKVVISIFGRTDPHRCGALDGQLVLHEATHGLTSRIIGDGYGLTKVQSRGMAEGWSDFFALSLLSETGDVVDACYPFGTYAAMFDDSPENRYYGIRRFPYSTNMTKAPQTFADTDPNQCSFPPEVPRNPEFGSEEADEVHNIGEVWCLALWECRANLIEEYGFVASEMTERLVVDGLKLTPEDPRFDQARDAILQAETINGGTNALTLWRGFAKRGLGYSAVVPEPQSTVGIVEAYDLPFDVNPITEEWGGDGDGYIEPGEWGTMTIILTSYELGLSNITATLSTESSNVLVWSDTTAFPDIPAGGTATSSAPFTFVVSPAFPGFTDAEFTLRIETDKGWFENPIAVRIGNPWDYPPEITDVAVTNITETNAWVCWTTGIPADGQVFYGLTTNYDMSTTFDSAMRTNHNAQLTNLAKGTVYHYQIRSEGTNKLLGVSTDMTFRTRARIYVYADSMATQELGTIAAPFKSLQAAAEEAKTTGDEIVVAMGTYIDAHPEAVLNLDGSDYDLTIAGGYSPDFSACVPSLYETVIDGERQRRGIRLDNGAVLFISGVTITKGSGEWGGGVHLRKSDFDALRCVIADNSSTNELNHLGGGLYATLGSNVRLEGCLIKDNLAGAGGGIEVVSSGTTIDMVRCVIASNAASPSSGGGAGFALGSSATILGCTVFQNSAETMMGGIAVAPFCNVVIENCTVTGNSTVNATDPFSDGGGGIGVSGPYSTGTLLVESCIVMSNHSAFGSDLRCGVQSEVHINYSNVGDIYGSLMTSNHLISSNPLFARLAGGDIHLLYGSPCIDAGSPDYSGGGTDMDGEPRVFGVRVDMGADEFTDVDGDHMADYWETNRFGTIIVSDGTPDDDADNLDDFGEYMAQTDPYNSDTDGDLGNDGFEVGLGMNPLDPDEDNDAMWDGWEAHKGLDWQTNDAALNPDGDWMVNVEEFRADTLPLDGDSFLALLDTSRARGGTRVDWKGGEQAWQWLEYSTNMRTWQPLAGFSPPRPVTNAVLIFGVDENRAVYRIRAER